jgi:hypothetical protein
MNKWKLLKTNFYTDKGGMERNTDRNTDSHKDKKSDSKNCLLREHKSIEYDKELLIEIITIRNGFVFFCMNSLIVQNKIFKIVLFMIVLRANTLFRRSKKTAFVTFDLLIILVTNF